MTAAEQLRYVSVDEYLAEELASQVKHEYLGGFVYAMAGARNAHNLIAGNVFGVLHSQLRGGPCRPYNSDTKIRLTLPTHTRFYYPDASVICDANSPDESFQDRPVIVVEVLSEKTRRLDLGEKKDAYLAVPSLKVYVLIEQDVAAATVFRRSEHGFVQEFHTETNAIIPLPEVNAFLPLSEAYDGVEFLPERKDV